MWPIVTWAERVPRPPVYSETTVLGVRYVADSHAGLEGTHAAWLVGDHRT